MRFLGLVAKNLFRRPMRSLLTLIALTTAIAAVVALLGISRGFTESFEELYAAHAVDIVVTRQGSEDRFSSSIDANYVERIEALPAVRRAAAVLLETMSLEDEGIYGIPTMGIAVNSWLLEDFSVKGSDTPPPSGTGQIGTSSSQTDSATSATSNFEPGSVLLGVHLADRLGLSRGDQLSLFGDTYGIAGVFESSSTWENGALILVLSDLQELTDRTNQATYINVVLQPPLSGEVAEKAIQSIADLDAKLLPLSTEEFVDKDTRMQVAGAMAWMTSAIAVIIGAVGTLNTMLSSVMERTKEIGILRAIGWPKSRVIRMILLESCGLSLAAGVFGTVLAVLLTWGLSQAPAAKGILSPSIDVSVILQGFVMAFSIGLMGAIAPAWRASQMLPTEAFREQ